MINDSDTVAVFGFLAVLLAVVELVCSGSVAGAMLRTRRWRPGRVYLYTMHEPKEWGFVPDVRCLAVISLLRLLNVEFEVKVIKRGDDCPAMEVDGQRFTEYHQIVNMLSLVHGHENRAETFWVNPDNREYVTAAMTRMVLTSTAPLLERWMWDPPENAAVMLKAHTDAVTPWALTVHYFHRRLHMEHSRQRGAYDPQTNEEFMATAQRDLETLERWMQKVTLFIDGVMPGPHDCIVYAALKCFLDTPLPSTLAPQERFPHSRKYVDRFEARLQRRDTASPRRWRGDQ
eukprot:TRINITY_DN25260_c0_g1_i1.p2 TRINITY_DN25260_c0_g1~~TRINITY_DN25260_c0_g1_i1.p2  ORF type:complete len:288 (+),score=96.49 TRINITY_DN25260_c0_g1_i1:100-963(+)